MVVCRYFQQGNCHYGQNCKFEHIYGSQYSFRASQSQNQRSNEAYNSSVRQGSSNSTASSVFRSAVQNNQAFNNAPNVFRSAVQNNQTFNNAPNNSIFQQNTQSRGSVFDRLGPEQNSTGNFQNTQAKSIFAQANESAFGPPTPPRNVFQMNNQNSAKSIFAQASQNIFGPAQSVNTSNQSSNTAGSLFARASQSLYNDPFNQQINSISSNTQHTAQSIFQISEGPTSNVFGIVGSVFDQSSNDSDFYSKMEDLSKSALEAFESLDFKLGFIPEIPPTKHLCV